MNIERILGIAFVAALAMTPPSNAATSQGAIPVKASLAATELFIQGHVLRESAEPLPQQIGREVILDSLWTYEVRVVRVLRGDERNKTITVVGESDPGLRTDRDFVFYLIRRPDGAYQLSRLQLFAGLAFESLASRTDAACPDVHVRFFGDGELGGDEDTFEEGLATSDQASFRAAIAQTPDGVPPSCERHGGQSCSVSINHLEAIKKAGQMERFVGFICATKPPG